jgi:hypothetical protein
MNNKISISITSSLSLFELPQTTNKIFMCLDHSALYFSVYLIPTDISAEIAGDYVLVVWRELKTQYPVLVQSQCVQRRFGLDVPQTDRRVT